MTRDDVCRGTALLGTGGAGLGLILLILGYGVWSLGPDLEDGRIQKNPKIIPGEPVFGVIGVGISDTEEGGTVRLKNGMIAPAIKLPPPPEPALPPAPDKDP